MSRNYRGPDSVGHEYDAWTSDGVLERYWGEHIHHGYYPEGRFRGVDFRAAKIDLVDRLLAWGQVAKATRVLDVGCGIGGSARFLARRFSAEVTGVTLSPAQAERARSLSEGLSCRFEVADALDLPFEDGSFDLVWACESGEHMPDKEAFMKEMARVLAPGGRLIMATWCHAPTLNERQQRRLERIYREWALPYFIPIEDYRALAEANPRLQDVAIGDWSSEVSPTWLHQIALGAGDLGWLIRQGPQVIGRSLRDAWAVKDMIRGYRDGSIRYGLLRAQGTARTEA